MTTMEDRRFDRKSALCRSAAAAVVCLAAAAAAHTASTAPVKAGGLEPSPQESELERVVAAAAIRAGSIVAEIGAGEGDLTMRVAKIVGDGGHVFSNEVSASRLASIRGKVKAAGAKNVTVVEGRADSANLPEACCEAVFMNDVYHHFTDPAAMNASILRALKPGGRLVVLDFGPPPGGESAEPARRAEDGRHGITPAMLESELRAAGFESISTETYGFRSSMTVARRPPSAERCSWPGEPPSAAAAFGPARKPRQSAPARAQDRGLAFRSRRDRAAGQSAPAARR